MALDDCSLALIVEIREEETQEVYFQIIRLENGEIGEVFSIDHADWWTTLRSLYYPFVFLEKYNNPEDPSEKDLLVVDLERKQEEVVSQFQLVRVEDGKIIGTDPKDQLMKREFTLDIKLTPSGANVNYPAYFAPGTESYETVAAFLELVDRELGCEYYEADDCIIICYYQRLGTEFVRKLLVMKGEAELYNGLIDFNLKGFASGGFLMVNNLLVFVENGNQINAIEL